MPLRTIFCTYQVVKLIVAFNQVILPETILVCITVDTIIIRQYIEVSTCTIFKTFFYKSNVILCIIYHLLWNACTSLYNLLELFFTPKCIFHASLLFHNAYSVIYGVIVIQIVRQYIFLLQALFISLFNHLLNITTIYIFPAR